MTPTKEENPEGLHRYGVAKADGPPTDENAAGSGH